MCSSDLQWPAAIGDVIIRGVNATISGLNSLARAANSLMGVDLFGQIKAIENPYAGAGKAVAEWIAGGEPSMDLWDVDIRRCFPHQANKRYLHDRTVEALASETGDGRFAYDSYRRFIQMYGNVVLGIDHHHFEELLERLKTDCGVSLDTELKIGRAHV